MDSCEVIDVICEPVKSQLGASGEKSTRAVLIYSKISGRTLVQPFYGICEQGDHLCGVFKDLRQCPTLSDMIQKHTLPKSTIARLSVACDVARTMDYLHSVEILLKGLSDRTVVISSTGGQLTPYIINLDTAREVRRKANTGTAC